MIKYNHDLISTKKPEELGITYPSYWSLLNDEEVTMKILLRIANKLNISLREIMYYEKED